LSKKGGGGTVTKGAEHKQQKGLTAEERQLYLLLKMKKDNGPLEGKKKRIP